MTETLLATPLESLHRRLGARLVPFAGYAMPVQYPAGILAEHAHCRAKAALFDVSHMGQVLVEGPGAAEALERATPADLVALPPGRQRYALLTTDSGGVLDDAMIARLADDRFFLVLNAARKAVDLGRLRTLLPHAITVTPLEDRALIALQGPAAEAVLARAGAQAAVALPFLGVAETTVAGVSALVSRSGYTGEDGFEISVAAEDAIRLAEILLADADVAPAGLGARDSLRLEAGLCLYGNDIDETTSPVEAGLVWTIGKRRRLAWDFPGAERIRRELDEGPARLRVGIVPEGRQPARSGTEVVGPDGTPIGILTSGTFGPSFGGPVAMGYVATAFARDGTPVELSLRGRLVPARIHPLPFVPHRYKRSNRTG
ncbi:glycine cleavage system aminomethyltransferase GcvT [Elioraea thermophila]|uniref:glycine cleavage system aminomethyltransferase GcvT n=1 Tax=Elioraea thermophila TaxID=2185104 RepID=UPI001E5F56A2|nr:glycine cleavage system aminomethyltransferase GcvT [Elioraea thermophila]